MGATIASASTSARLIEKIAASLSPILLLTCSSEDAHAFAQFIHRLSPRANRPFIRTCCGLYPAKLLEHQFFGRTAILSRSHFRPTPRQPGLVEQAHTGTLYVEQLQHATPSLQDGLLRLITGKAFCDPITGTALDADVRLIAAVPAPIAVFARPGRIHIELAERLNATTLLVPPHFASTLPADPAPAKPALAVG